MRLRGGTPGVLLGSAMLVLAFWAGWLGLHIHNGAEATRARLNGPINFSRDNDRLSLDEADRSIKTLAIVGATLACLGVYMIEGGRRMNRSC